MDNDRSNIILHEFPPEFNCLKELAKELRMALSPIRPGALFRGTWRDPKKVHTPMLDAFDKAILKIGRENGWGKFAQTSYFSIGFFRISQDYSDN